jgi:MYXO-CTERM domain-containing protein
MMGRRLTYVLAAAAALLVPAVASAHIHMTQPLSRTDSPTGDQKEAHCGTLGYVRADHPDRVTTFAPGATVTVNWDETIQHPGWFRIAFQPNGETFTIPVCGTVAAPAECAAGEFPTENLEGVTLADGSIVLDDMILDGTLTATVTLPNIECENCTLQFIQLMTDKAPYTTDAASDDIYFNCADVRLSNTPLPDAAPAAGADADPGNPGDDDSGGGGGATGGCSTSGGSSGILLALGLGALLVRRRRA